MIYTARFIEDHFIAGVRTYVDPLDVANLDDEQLTEKELAAKRLLLKRRSIIDARMAIEKLELMKAEEAAQKRMNEDRRIFEEKQKKAKEDNTGFIVKDNGQVLMLRPYLGGSNKQEEEFPIKDTSPNITRLHVDDVQLQLEEEKAHQRRMAVIEEEIRMNTDSNMVQSEIIKAHIDARKRIDDDRRIFLENKAKEKEEEIKSEKLADEAFERFKVDWYKQQYTESFWDSVKEMPIFIFELIKYEINNYIISVKERYDL
jgi:hypothetical protein